jgi:parvulin-like peptidyl-prolyl isomerase
MNRNIKIFPAVIILALLIGCAGGKQATPIEEVTTETDSLPPLIFAEISDLKIDSDMMAAKMGSRQIMGQMPVIDSATALKAVYEISLDSILGRDAVDFDLSVEQPSLYLQYLQLRFDRVIGLMFQEVIVDPVQVSDSAMLALYEAEKDTFLVPDQYRARHIVIAGQGFKHAEDSLEYRGMSEEKLDSLAHSKIVDLREQLLAGDNFEALAMAYSQDANTSDWGGDLGYFELARMVSPFDSTVEHTPIGEISGVIKTGYGWHILKVEDFAPEHYIPFDSVCTHLEQKVKQKIVAENSRKYIDSLRSSAIIEFDTMALQMADSLHSDGDAMAYVNPDDKKYGNDTLYFRDYNESVFAYRRYKKIEGELSFDDKIEILTTISTRVHLRQASRKLGYYNHPSIEEWAEQTVKKYAVSTLRKRFMQSEYEPTEEELRAHYDAHLDDYVIERPVTVRHIVFADSNLAEHVRDQLLSGMDFMEMVDQYYPGDPDIKRAAADLGEIGPDDMPSEFFKAAMRTPVNSITRPVKTMYGYHLIKVLDKALSIKFENARTNIKLALKKIHQENRLHNYVESRLGEAPVIHWELIDKLYFRKAEKPDFSFGRNP